MGILSITTMKTFTGAWFFYEGDAVRTVWQEGRCSSLIQAAGMRLVERKVANDLQQTMMLASDGMGSVVGESGTRSKSVAYSPYGFQRGMESLIGFAGQMQSLLPIGYFLGNGYRFFDVVTHRFNSPDEFSPFGRGGVNAYVYCGGDPVNRTDPSGHMIYYVGSSSRFDWVGTRLKYSGAGNYYSEVLFRKSQVQYFPRIEISPRSEGAHASLKRAASPVEAGVPKRVKQEGGLIQNPRGGVEWQLLRTKMIARIENSDQRVFSNGSVGAANRAMALEYLDIRGYLSASSANKEFARKYPNSLQADEVRKYVSGSIGSVVDAIRDSHWRNLLR
jgi:RHS repeat-associated protein